MAVTGFKELLARSDSSGSRSTILKPITWFISILIVGFTTLVEIKASQWIVALFFLLIIVTVGVFFYAYIYCLHKDRDALRSEKFTIQKMAIEKGFVGDDISGIFSSDEKKSLGTGESSNKSQESQ